MRMISYLFIGLVCSYLILFSDKAAADEISCSLNPFKNATCVVEVGFFDSYGIRSIKSAAEHKPLLDLLNKAKKDDKIIMNFLGNGGSTNTTMAIMLAMSESKAHIVAKITGPVYSAHAFIPLAADEIDVAANTLIMYHTSSVGGVRDPMSLCMGAQSLEAFKSCVKQVKANFKATALFLKYYMKNVLTDEQKQRFNAGEDVYITGKQLMERLKK